MLAPLDIRFSQDSICKRFKERRYTLSVNETLREIACNKLSSDVLLPIDVVSKSGQVYSLDNRRLYIFRVLQLIGKVNIIDVRYVTYNPYIHQRKFTTDNNGLSVRVRGDITYRHNLRTK